MNKITISLIFILLMVPTFLYGLPTFILLVAGLVPAIVAFLVDQEKERTSTICVFYMNSCGVLPQIIQLWHTSHTLEYVRHLLLNPYTWLVMYGAAAVGWVLYLVVPLVVSKITFLYGYQQIQGWRRRQQELIEEWGPGVKK